MNRRLRKSLLVAAAWCVITHAAHAGSPVDVDVNGAHLVVRGDDVRQWNQVTVEINDWWTFTATNVHKTTPLCLNLKAFTVKPSVRVPGNSYEGIRFNSRSMKVTKLTIVADGTAVPLHSLTSGMIKPLTTAEAAPCIG